MRSNQFLPLSFFSVFDRIVFSGFINFTAVSWSTNLTETKCVFGKKLLHIFNVTEGTTLKDEHIEKNKHVRKHISIKKKKSHGFHKHDKKKTVNSNENSLISDTDIVDMLSISGKKKAADSEEIEESNTSQNTAIFDLNALPDLETIC